MRHLQNISVLEGIETPLTCFPGNWTDVTADSSVQIICLDRTAELPTQYADNICDNKVNDARVFLGNSKTQSCADLNVSVHHNGLSEKAWFSDSCLNERPVIKGTQNKEFSSTGDITNDCVNKTKQLWKPILRKFTKNRRSPKKSVSFKASEAETRYFIKCDINENNRCDNEYNDAFTEFDIRRAEVEVNSSSVGQEGHLVLKKPVKPISEVKVAKVVKCPTLSKNSASHAIKRKLSQIGGDNNKHHTASPLTDLSEADDEFPELVYKIPRYSVDSTQHSSIGPLSTFLMENDSNVLTSTPKVLMKSGHVTIENMNQTTPQQDQHKARKYNRPAVETRLQFRMGTSNLRTIRCQRKLPFNDHVNANVSEVISSIEQQLESVNSIPKQIRPRLGLQCKSSKLVDLDTLDINLVCEMKDRISKCNTGMKIKTNGSLQCRSKLRTISAPSPMRKCFKRTVRPSPVAVRQGLRLAPCLETLV